MMLRFLNVQGIAGIAVSVTLAILLIVQKGETYHWKKQSASFEQLYHQGQAAFATTVADYRAATARARIADQANAQRVAAEQRAVNERTSDDYQTRLAAARAAAQRLRLAAETTTRSGAGGSARMPALSAPSGSAAQAPGQNRLSPADALTATEQAIQLDELIRWIKTQSQIDPNRSQNESRGGAENVE